MIEERSAGAVVFTSDDLAEVEYLILHYTADHWDFPKGNIEKGEKEEATIRREIYEETAIKGVSIVPGFSRKVEYHYRRNKSLVHKEVVFWLARSPTKAVKISHEHMGFEWLNCEKALNRLTFDNTKSVLRDAHAHLSQLVEKGQSLDQYLYL